MKTATTTIQRSFEQHADLLYQLSSAVYLGKFSWGGACRRPHDDGVAYCVDPERFALYATPQSAKEFAHAAGVLRRDGVGAVVSMEELSLGIINPDHDLFFGSVSGLRKEWNVTLCVTYRRYFEWILSSYNQIEKHRLSYRWPRRSSINTGIDRATTCTFGRWFEGLHRHSDGGGDAHTNATTCYYRWIRSFDPSVHPVDYIIHKFRAKLDGISIRVFNMHQEGDLFTNFVVSPLSDKVLLSIDDTPVCSSHHTAPVPSPAKCREFLSGAPDKGRKGGATAHEPVHNVRLRPVGSSGVSKGAPDALVIIIPFEEGAAREPPGSISRAGGTAGVEISVSPGRGDGTAAGTERALRAGHVSRLPPPPVVVPERHGACTLFGRGRG
mmetsp:Transcript_7831/g.16313  ORF Transcript_7831/g.16313 Transcript_7831/m.16313 type:complete len:383 (-) Transcript_7831:210-1358(-)